ncbi:MAG TPA: hypothetical protein VMW27_21560 [Thermoanaerobaculia bacterium]|nr:hypothetical protein [Thermoanaerobaculia bacterium]
MSSLLSAISGKFSTNLILGTFFPVTVFVFLARMLWVPLLPAGFSPVLAKPLAGLDDKWELLVLTLVTVVLSGLLYNLNIPLIRLYEGYPWQDTWIGRRKTDRYRAELRALLAEKEGAYPLAEELRKEAGALPKNDPRIRRLRVWADAAEGGEADALRAVFQKFPKPSSVLPTELGNLIRSFENYPERQYGMSAIALWPRLIDVLDNRYAEAIDAAKAGLDFMLNSATLSWLLALFLLVTGLVYPAPLAASGSAGVWLTEIVLLVLLALWLYKQSLEQANTWGDLVRGAFDLYRGKLLEKLGYTKQPKTVDDERRLWWAISSRLISGDPPSGRGKIPPYSASEAPPTSCRCDSSAGLLLARGVVPLASGHGLEVVLEVRNPAWPPRVPEQGIVVVDTVPEEFELLWGSQSANAGTADVEGTNPYSFRLSEPLAPQERRQLMYHIVPRKTGD